MWRAFELRQLLFDLVAQGFARAERASCCAGALDMTPHQFVRVQVGCIPGQEVQRQSAFRRSDVVAYRRGLVRGQTVEHQMHGLPATAHQLAQQQHKPFGFERAVIRTKPERPVSGDRGGCTDRLALSRSMDHRGLAAHAPSLAVHRIGTKSRLVPEIHCRALSPRLPSNGRERLALPALDSLGIPLIGPLQRLLRGQTQLRQQFTDRRDRKRHPELLRDQLSHHLSRPQTEVQAILSRVAPVDPAKYLPLLGSSQGSRAPRGLRRPQRLDADTRLQRRFEPLVDRGAVETERCHHFGRRFTFAHALYRHQPNSLQARAVKCTAVSFHVRSDPLGFKKFHQCRLIYRLPAAAMDRRNREYIAPDDARAQIHDVVGAASQVVLGKRTEIRLAMACLLARGHLLIEDLPGVGKTTLAHLLAKLIGLSYKRIQFASDLLPADVIGVYVYKRETGDFEFHPGPVFSHVVLADEVNRATPRARSALLEAMEERQVTIENDTHRLPEPFFVIATQNPGDQVGTSPLPESQLDRFLMRISLGYPDRVSERKLLIGQDRREMIEDLVPVLDAQSEVDPGSWTVS